MMEPKRYFFCGIGGSGMLPLALILKGQGHEISGSDRALDQGRSAAKFDYLRRQGIQLYPQDGSGLVSPEQTLVASAAIEDTVPDVAAALRIGAHRLSRPELLSSLFNAAKVSIGVAGTSGKSTTTGMIGWVLHQAGRNPTVMNGAVMKNFATQDALFASALVGDPDLFVSEVDESDGSIARYDPTVALVNNIAHDHKSMDELRDLFRGYVTRSDKAVLNRDNPETEALFSAAPYEARFSLTDPAADYFASDILPAPTSIRFTLNERLTGTRHDVVLKTPGRHNVANALAASAACAALGLDLQTIAAGLRTFEGLKRRFDIVGTRGGVTVIDDFGHNPDKIAATLETLHAFPGRLLILFQPHGFGPLRTLKSEFTKGFVSGLGADDLLVMPEPVYFGGTVDRSVSSRDIVAGIVAGGRDALALDTREACGEALLDRARSGDRIVIMGARDDTLSDFAADLLARLPG